MPERGGPPSEYAIYSLSRGESGALGRVAVLTLVRAGMISPGLYLSGSRGRTLVVQSLAASAAVSVLLFGWYALGRSER